MTKLNKDLSTYHELIGDLFPKISAKDAWDAYKLSDEQVQFFHTHGFLSGVKLLEEEQVAHLNQELVQVMDPTHPKHDLFHEFHSNESTNPDTVLFHSLGHWRITLGFHDVLWNPRFVVAACQLLGNKSVRFWHDQLFCKPPHHGGVVAWHQDYSYWTRTIPLQHLTCWVALDDVNEDNGCIHYIPGSHKWELLDMPSLAGDMEGLNTFLNQEQQSAFAKKIPAIMPKGYGTFHHPLMVHGSYENRSPNPRRAFVINVFADGTISNTDGELLQGVPVIPKGHKMEGQFFPLLFRATDLC